MPVDLAIKGVPDDLAEKLRHRAAEHQRSLDEEVVDILQAGVGREPKRSFSQLLARVRELGVRTPAEAAAMVREDRDGGHRD